MSIEKSISKYPDVMDGFKKDDAIIFMIDENCDDFKKKKINKERKDLALVSRMPYDNIFIIFKKNKSMWVTSKQINEGMYLSIRTNTFGENGYDMKLCLDFDNFDFYEAYFHLSGDIASVDARLYKLNLNDDLDVIIFFEHFVIIDSFLRILSCKNIRKKKISPPEKLQKKRRKNGKKLLLSYYTLQLSGFSGHSESKPHQNLWSNRIHLVRGHMREYSKDKPLFGKYHGRYWIAPHARGDKKQGIIIKDYEIKNDKSDGNSTMNHKPETTNRT